VAEPALGVAVEPLVAGVPAVPAVPAVPDPLGVVPAAGAVFMVADPAAVPDEMRTTFCVGATVGTSIAINTKATRSTANGP
jgi:hypothetical protein